MRLVIDLQACQSSGNRVRGIGRYSLALAQAMVRNAGSHECVIALNAAMVDSVEPMRGAFTELLPADRIRSWASVAKIAEAFHGGARRSQVAGELFRQAMREFRPDFVHITSVFEGSDNDVTNVVGSRAEGLPTAVTLYDLIPLAQSDVYLAQPAVRDWYMRKLDQLKRAELLLAISTFTKSEGVNLLGIEADRIVNIRGACDDVFQSVSLTNEQRLALYGRYGIHRPYLMYAGGFDSRKNILSLIRAYAALPQRVRDAHQLLIVGSPPGMERKQIETLRSEMGLLEDQCVLLGYVSDQDLAALYSDCRLYAFPSLQEGFGLPALEAMACGAVVVGSNVSSLPEVIGFSDALFDPYDVGQITQALYRGLCDEGFRRAFLEHARNQVKQFSWEESARLAWSGLESAHDRQQTGKRAQVPVSYVGVTPEAKAVAGHLSSFVDSSDVPLEQMLDDVAARYMVIADSTSALRAWQVMRRRTVGVVVSGQEVIARAVRELNGHAEGKRVLDFILADQGAYAVALREGEAYFAGLEQTVYAWMDRVAAGVIRSDSGMPAEPDALVSHRCGRDGRALEAVERMVSLPIIPPASDEYWKDVAEALNHNRQADSDCTTRLLLDISQLVVRDARSGIQRVVRNLLRKFLLEPPAGRQVLPVHFDEADGSCRYARGFSWRFLGLPEIAAAAEDEIVDWLPGDQLVGLDLSAHIIPVHQERFARLRDLGVGITIVLYDMLPDIWPELFDSGMVEAMRRWYRSLAELSDGIVCISDAVAGDFVNWLDQVKIERSQPLKVGYFHLGADPEIDAGSQPSADEQVTLDALKSRPTVLMVSTIEPRKGYQQALEAFEQLWQQGVQVNLAIVGKAGWRTEALVEHMRNHPEAGQRLHWFEGASDAMLHALYQGCDLLLSASEGEGFGLPVIEAAQYGIPLLLRNLAVFKEIAGEHAGYFEGFEASDLSRALAGWLEGRAVGRAWPDSRGVKWLTWQQSYQQFLDVLEGRRWTYEVGNTPRYWFPSSDPRMQTQSGVYKRGQLHASGSPGMLIYGPYAKVLDGTYRLRAYGAMDRSDPESWLDVVSDCGSRTLFKGELMCVPGDENEVLLEGTMTLSRPVKDLEIRVWSSGQSQLRLVGFELVRQLSA